MRSKSDIHQNLGTKWHPANHHESSAPNRQIARAGAHPLQHIGAPPAPTSSSSLISPNPSKVHVPPSTSVVCASCAGIPPPHSTINKASILRIVSLGHVASILHVAPNGVWPVRSRTVTSAPTDTKNSTNSSRPTEAASCNALHPVSSVASTSAPDSTNTERVEMAPVPAAITNTGMPLSLKRGSAPPKTRSRITSTVVFDKAATRPSSYTTPQRTTQNAANICLFIHSHAQRTLLIQGTQTGRHASTRCKRSGGSSSGPKGPRRNPRSRRKQLQRSCHRKRDALRILEALHFSGNALSRSWSGGRCTPDQALALPGNFQTAAEVLPQGDTHTCLIHAVSFFF